MATIQELKQKKCVPCEGGVPTLERSEAARLLSDLPGWEMSDDAKWIKRKWIAKNFMAAIAFIDRVAALAEDEGHHPDIHLTGYRNITIELTTHAIGGLSENDFVVAAKVNDVPIDLKK